MVHVRNEESRDLVRCMPPELLRLQRCMGQHMQDTLVEGRPLIGELMGQVDKDRAIRETVWERVAQSDPTFAAMLSGARWGNDRPQNFAQRLVKAKYEMERRLNGPYRHRAKVARMKEAQHLLLRTNLTNQSHSVDEADPERSPGPTALSIKDEDEDEDISETAEPRVESRAESTQLVDRPALSPRVETAFEDIVTDLNNRIALLEQRLAMQDHERERWEAELEKRLFARMNTALAQRDAEIQSLRAELEAERSWQES